MFLPSQIAFGWGVRRQLGSLAASLGRRAFLLTGSNTLRKSGLVAELENQLAAAGVDVIPYEAPQREPHVGDVDQLTERWLSHAPQTGDIAIAIGGGSTIDLAKAAAAMVVNREGTSVGDYLEGVGRGLKITQDPLPLVAVPTTAGTGTEVTKNAVISSAAPAFKKSLRSDRMIPRIVLVDPELTVSVPPAITAYTGMDAITQLIESYISRRAAPIPQALCREGLQHAFPALPRAFRQPDDREARTAMAHAALLSGMALANSGLGVAHGVAAALGVHCDVPHGLACAVMLAPALRFNRQVRERELAELSRLVSLPSSGDDGVAAGEFIAQIDEMCRVLQIPRRLRDLGVRFPQIPELVDGSRGNSLSGNPRDVSDVDLRELLESLW